MCACLSFGCRLAPMNDIVALLQTFRLHGSNLLRQYDKYMDEQGEHQGDSAGEEFHADDDEEAGDDSAESGHTDAAHEAERGSSLPY